MDKKDYRPVIKHLFKTGKNASDIYRELISTDGDDAPSLSTVRYWTRKFRCGQEGTEDDPRTGRPNSAIDATSIEAVARIVEETPTIGIRSIAAEIKSSYGSAFKVLHDHLYMQKMYTKWVPYELSDLQKQTRIRLSRRFLRQFGTDFEATKSILITSDETWVKYATPETSESSREWRISGSSRPEKSRISPRSEKVMLTVWWDARGVILLDFWKRSDKISFNAAYYQEMIKKLRKTLPTVRRGMLMKGPRILVDNAPVHRADASKACFAECGLKTIETPTYSPDIAPSDYYLFRNLKTCLRSVKFDSRETLEREVSAWFASKPASYYERGIEQLPERLKEVIKIGGAYLH